MKKQGFLLGGLIFLFTSYVGIADDSVEDIVSLTKRADGLFDVVCSNGTKVIVTAEQIKNDEVCRAQPVSAPLPISTCEDLTLPGGEFHYACKASDLSAGTRPVDLLWVVDDSASMGPNQNKLASISTDLMENLKPIANWKMGMITTTAGRSPLMGVPGVPELKSSTPNSAFVFSAVIKDVGQAGSGEEKVFSPTLQMLKQFPGFLTPNSQLAVIFITDAKEQSSMTPTAFLSELGGLAGGLDHVTLYGILNSSDSSCAKEMNEEPWNYAGSVYESAIRATKGERYLLCDPMGKVMKDLGSSLINRAMQFHPLLLPQGVDGSSIRVWFQGKPLPRGVPSKGGAWDWDSAKNTVQLFLNELMLDSQARIRISYR